jgi:hypothetical protein
VGVSQFGLGPSVAILLVEGRRQHQTPAASGIIDAIDHELGELDGDARGDHSFDAQAS